MLQALSSLEEKLGDEALLKIPYLATIDIKKWVKSIRSWSKILEQLSIYFDERLDNHLY